jgi:carbon-monoxide dehydrogenase catalytic subunit
MKHHLPVLNVDVPDKAEHVASTPNLASRELLQRLEELGAETLFDRYEQQKPQCTFGLTGRCCRMCQWGPCRIGRRAERGICGKDQNAMVIGNVLRALVAGLSAHGRHAHEAMFSVLAAAEGRAHLAIKGEERVLDLARRFQVPADGRPIADVAREVTRILLEDLGRLDAAPLRTLEAFAPPERQETWSGLGILPRSASYEVMEALHMTTLGGCTDWTALAAQELRAALAYCYSTLFGSSFATEMLFGLPQQRITTVNYGILKADHVNVLMHGHSPVMVEVILEKLRSREIEQLARAAGAEGIVVGGLCCSGEELLARHGVSTVTNIGGQELVLGTGAVDAVVVDMQCVIPGAKILADCFGTQIITTSRSNRIPGALHVPFDPEQPEQLHADAERVARAAVEAFGRRDRSKMHIPQVTTAAQVGWSYENILETLGGAERIVELLREGKLKGIATIVGCNTPKVPYEHNHVTLARELIRADVLLLTTGCCAHALLNDGLCGPGADDRAGPGLARLCRELGIPPVLAVGGCVDNTRTLRLFAEISRAAGVAVKDLPFMFIGPEPGNEKTVGQGLTFLVHGVSNLVGFPGPIPPAIPRPKPGEPGELERGSNDVVDFLAGAGGVLKLVGAKIYTEPEPRLGAQLVRMHLRRKRLALGWAGQPATET